MAIIDPFSDASFPVWAMFGSQELGHATGSFWSRDGRIFLISNWHVFTGRDPNTLTCTHRMGGVPDNLLIKIDTKDGNCVDFIINLFEQEEPLWLVHPDFGRKVDISAIEIKNFEFDIICCINELPQVEINTRIGDQLFVIGFPFDPKISSTGHFPIWKAANVATEPDFSPDLNRFMLVDTATRKGMSGAPVIQRVNSMFSNGSGIYSDLIIPATSSYPATKIVGIYSGRLHTHSDLDAQLGMVWPTKLVSELLSNGRRDCRI